MAAKSPPAGWGNKFLIWERGIILPLPFGSTKTLRLTVPNMQNKATICIPTFKRDRLRHSVGTTGHYLTKSTLLLISSPTLPEVGWLTHAMSPPTHTLLPWGLPSSCFPVLPPSRAPTGTQRANFSALILKAISNYLAAHLPLFSIKCAVLVLTSIESFQQLLPFQRALQTTIYTLNRY